MDKKSSRSDGKIQNKFSLKLSQILSTVIFLFLSFFISALVIVSMGLSERISMHVGILFGLIISLLFFRLTPLFQKSTPDTTKILKESVVFLVLMEFLILAFTPLHSLVPEKALLRLSILQKIDAKPGCDTKTEIIRAANFMKNNIDLGKVKLYYGGEPEFTSKLGFIFPQTKAAAYGNFIYVSKSEPCLDSATLVHELAHVWQYQIGMGFGPKWIPYWISYYWKYFTNINSLYDYGGNDGIKKAMDQGKNLSDFGLEQQANIVEDYYKLMSSDYSAGFSRISRSEDFNVIRAFMEQKINFGK